MLNDFHFLRPEWLFALPFIALLLGFLLKRTKQNSSWESICDAELLNFQLAQNSSQKKNTFVVLHWLIPLLFFISIIALAGPSWEKKEQPVFQQGNALVIILDLSLSMNAKDIKPSRLERSKLKLIDILNQKKEGQTALIAFAGDAHTVSPLTIDNKTIISLLPALDSSIMPMRGSHLVDALNSAGQLFKNAGFARGDILLLTDGIDPSQQSRLKKTVKTLRQQGYFVSIIGVGTQTGSPIPLPGQSGFVKDQSGQVVLSKLLAEPLIKLTQLGNGQYKKLSLDDSDFKILLKKLPYNDKPEMRQKDQIEQWYDAGVYLTLLLIPIALFGFRKGLLTIAPLCLLIPCLFYQTAEAAEPASELFNGELRQSFHNLWSTADQQAKKLFNNKDYNKAAQQFKHNNWKASALYRNGDFEQALKYYSQSDTAQSLYNKGNTLANMGQFTPAKEAYEQALKKKHDFSAAEQNLNYMEELIEQQKQSQENSDNSSDNKKNKKSENQQQDQKNSSDNNSSKSNESDSKDSKEKDSDNNDSEGSKSSKKDQENKASEQDKTNEAQSEQDKATEQEQQQNTPSEPKKDEPQDKDQQIKQASQADPAIMEEQEKARKEAKEQEENKEVEDDNQPSGSENTKADILSQLNQEQRQSLKQWLQRIPDNPGQLLKVKFRNNTLIKQRQMDTEDHYEGDPW